MSACNSSKRERLLSAHGHRCVWCSVKLTCQTATADHVRCVSEGGTNWLGNLLPSCRHCNNARGDMSIKSWLRECLQREMRVQEQAVQAAIARAHWPEQTNFYVEHSSGVVSLREHQLRVRRSCAQQRLNAASEAMLGPSFYWHKAMQRSRRQERAAISYLQRETRR